MNVLSHYIIDRKWKIRNWNFGMDFPYQKTEYNNVVLGTDFQLKLSILHLFAIITDSLDLGLSIYTTRGQFYLVRKQ